MSRTTTLRTSIVGITALAVIGGLAVSASASGAAPPPLPARTRRGKCPGNRA